MSSTDSPSEARPPSAAETETTRPLALPTTMAGCTADGPNPIGGGPAHEMLAALRRFHLSGVVSEPLNDTLAPASLHFAKLPDATSERTLLLLGNDAEASGLCGTLLLWPSLIQRLQQGNAALNGSSVLQQHLDEFRSLVAQVLPKHDGLAPAQEVFLEAGQAWLAKQDGDTASRQALLQEIHSVGASWGVDARILLPSQQAYLHLLLHVAEYVYFRRRSVLCNQIEELTELLRAFLTVDSTKDDTARSSQGLQRTMGHVGAAFLNTQQLAQSLGQHRGAAQLPYEQRQRAEEILESLQKALSNLDGPYAVIIHDGSLDTDAWARSTWDRSASCEIVQHDDPCRGASDLFEVRARESASLFRDMHIARLLLESRYEPARHDPWFERFDWRGFTQEELSHLPVVVALDTAERLSAGHLPSLSALLLSSKPVQILALQSPWHNPASPDEEPSHQARMELGYLGMGHRQALVQQGSLQQPEHLTEGYRQALESPHPALHVVAQHSASQPDRDWLHSEAATLSRAHPLFCYNPDAGSTWARRMDFSGNLHPQKDWATLTIALAGDADATQDWQVPCTFADFALLQARLHHHFMQVADDCRSDDLLRLDHYLQLPQDEARHCLPWIWASDEARVLHRLVLTRSLAQACRDRLDYWHTLQELSGVRNQYVEDAVEQTREEERRTHEVQIQRLASEHAAALQSLERDTVKKSMKRLSRMLLDLDPLSAKTSVSLQESAAKNTTESTTSATVVTPAPAVTAPPATAASDAAASAAADPQTEEHDTEEPWIESALCTSCNDCLEINGQLFVYNENKQAFIGDPHSGTFKQLVIAAEKCPAHCIHPGTPLNKQEANLESLIKRAAPFN